MDKENRDIELGEDEEYVVTLVSEDGEEENFVVLDVIERDNSEYAVLQAEAESQSDDEAEVLIFKMEGDGDDGTQYLPIEDEELLNSIFDEFLSRMDEESED